MKNRNLFILLDILALAAALAVNALAVSLPLNGLTTREISDSFDIYFVPAGYVFLIWSLIYVQLIVFVVYRSLPQQRENSDLARIDGWFILSCAANALWLVSFHYQRFVLALGFMLVLLTSLIVIFQSLRVGKHRTDTAWRWMVDTTFSVYLAWVSVATIANVTQVLDFVHWDGFGIAPEVWTVIMVAFIVGLAAIMSFTRRVFEFNLVLIWALVGIALKFPYVPLVNYGAWAGAILIALIGMIALTIPISLDKS